MTIKLVFLIAAFSFAALGQRINPKSNSGAEFIYYKVSLQFTKKKVNNNGDSYLEINMEPREVKLELFPKENITLKRQSVVRLSRAMNKYNLSVIMTGANTLLFRCKKGIKQCEFPYEEFKNSFTKLFKKIPRHTLNGTLGSYTGIWEIFAPDNNRGLIINSESQMTPFVVMELRESTNSPSYMGLNITMANRNEMLTKIIIFKKNNTASPISMEQCYFVETEGQQKIAASPIYKHGDAFIKTFGAYLGDLPQKLRDFFTPQMIEQINTCG